MTNIRQLEALIYIVLLQSAVESWFGPDDTSVCDVRDTVLDCKDKNLTVVPKLPDHHASVTYLDFSLNKMKSFSFINISNPSAILGISLSHNTIESFKVNVFSNMTNLEDLDLSYNKIRDLDFLRSDTFGTFGETIGKLKRLSLKGNELNTLKDDTFSQFTFPYLEHLDLSHCSLKSLGYTSFERVTTLTHLNLSYNLLTKFEISIVGDELKSLDLSYNKIKVVNKVPAILSLKYLFMDYNGIVSIKNGVFNSLLEIEILSLIGNNLKTLQPQTLPLDSMMTDDLKEIRLDKNPWRCDCNMKWLLKHREDETTFRNFTIICTYPSRLRGKDILTASSDELKCSYEYSRLVYILILLFSSGFMMAGIGFLVYVKRKHLMCFQEKGGNYVAVYTNDDANADDSTSVKITTTDDETLINNEFRTGNGKVHYFDV